MDLNKLVARAKAILLTPRTEWPVIAGESTTVGDLYKGYIMILAAIPAVFGFIGVARIGLGAGLSSLLVSYALGLASVYVMALIVNALAPTFGGQKDSIQALKAVAYAGTAGWVAGVAQIIPFLGVLISLAAAIYSIYLLYLGLPHTMKCPPEKAAGYTAVVVIIFIVVGALIGLVVGSVTGVGSMMGGSSYRPSEDSTLGQMQKWANEMEAASKKLEAAQQSGDQAAQEEALKAMFGAALGGGSQVESLAPERLKQFVPAKLAGLPRSSISSERSGAMGLQVSNASAIYADEDSGRELRLEITDVGTARGLLGLASWAGVEGEKESDGFYEKTYRKGGRLIHEEWDSHASTGEYTVVVGERFTVKVEGGAGSIRELRSAAEELDLDGLAKLRTEGVKN